MNTFSYIYIATIILLYSITIYVRLNLIIKAKSNRLIQLLMLTLMIVIGVASYSNSQNINDIITNVFLILVLLDIIIWKNGISKTYFVIHFLQFKIFKVINDVNIINIGNNESLVVLKSGSLISGKIKFNMNANDIKKLLKQLKINFNISVQ